MISFFMQRDIPQAAHTHSPTSRTATAEALLEIKEQRNLTKKQGHGRLLNYTAWPKSWAEISKRKDVRGDWQNRAEASLVRGRGTSGDGGTGRQTRVTHTGKTHAS